MNRLLGPPLSPSRRSQYSERTILGPRCCRSFRISDFEPGSCRTGAIRRAYSLRNNPFKAKLAGRPETFPRHRLRCARRIESHCGDVEAPFRNAALRSEMVFAACHHRCSISKSKAQATAMSSSARLCRSSKSATPLRQTNNFRIDNRGTIQPTGLRNYEGVAVVQSAPFIV